MTVQLNWPPDLVERLTKEAHQQGLSLDAYILETILDLIRPNRAKSSRANYSDETLKSRARQKAGESIRELRKGNVLGPDITIGDLIEEGRRFGVRSFLTTP